MADSSLSSPRTADLETRGFALVRDTDPAELARTMAAIASTLGLHHTLTELMAEGDPHSLPIHTEGIYREQPLRYFLLGCMTPALVGGDTTIFDARGAAGLIAKEHPELTPTRIEYRSSYARATAAHDLLIQRRLNRGSRSVLIFRQRVPANNLLNLNDGWTPQGFYEYIDSVLSRSMLTSHRWRTGDVLVVDNAVTLHGRTPFSGCREMLRLRVDDSVCPEA